jgi:uncharacterized membrane protein
MIGFLIGTACLIGLVKMMCHGPCNGRWHPCARGMSCGWRDHDGHGGRWGCGGMQRWMLRGLFERLDTTPGQEKVILRAVEGLREQTQAGRAVLRETARHAARALRSDRVDEGAMAEAFAKQNAAIEAMQKALFEALSTVHEALDERQRRAFADLLEGSAGPWFPWPGSPYRS